MRVTGVSQARGVATAKSTRRAAGSGRAFEPPRAGSQRRASAVRGAATLASADTILALQMQDETERRKRQAVNRGTRMLDLLDELKVGLLGGGVRDGNLRELERAVESERNRLNDPRLDDVLDQIALRAKVELAKLMKIAS